MYLTLWTATNILYSSILQAVDALNGSEVKTCKLYVARAQKKNERQAELREKYEKLKMERLNRYQQGKKGHKFVFLLAQENQL